MNRSFIGAVRPVLIGVLVFILSADNSHAQEKGVNLQELTRRSDLVAVGKVREKRSAWDAGRSGIETTITVDVEQLLKGSSGQTIEIVTQGGEVGGVGEYYSHTAQFVKGEEIVVFAARDRKNRLRVAGGSSGKQSVTTDPASGEKIVGGMKRLSEFVTDVKNSGRGN